MRNINVEKMVEKMIEEMSTSLVDGTYAIRLEYVSGYLKGLMDMGIITEGEARVYYEYADDVFTKTLDSLYL